MIKIEQKIICDEISTDDMPVPVGWRLLIQPIKVEEMTASGIALPKSAQEAKEYLRCVGKVISMGPLCYRHNKFEGGEPWCKIGDWVVFGEYVGRNLKIRNQAGGLTDVRLISDDEVVSRIPNPEAVLIYV